MTEYYRRHLEDQQVHRRWMDPRLSRVKVEDIRSYLVARGWKPVAADRPAVLVFQEPEVGPDGPLYQWVPDSEQRRDYPQQVYELLAAIAETEDRHAGDVLADILQQPTESAGKNGSAGAVNVGVRPG